MIKLLIFDVGGVIDTFDESKYISYISRKLRLDQLKFGYALIPLLDKMEVSKISLSQMKGILANKFGVSQESLEWDEAFKRLNRVNWDVVYLINNLSRHYKIAILTNVSRSRHMVKMENYLEKVKYDGMFTSCYLKMAKPDPRIYRHVLKGMEAKPNEAIFVDNLKRNTDGAERVGIKSIQFTDYDELVSELRAFGIKVKR